MEALQIRLHDCYGIHCMSRRFELSDTRHVAIYAPNGTMKSSLAKTFKDAGEGRDSEEVVCNRTSSRVIEDGDGKAVPPDGILVIDPLKDSQDIHAASLGILANEKLRSRYGAAVAGLVSDKETVIKKLAGPSGLAGKTEDAVLRDFGKGGGFTDFFAVLEQCLDAPPDADLSDVRYVDVFNEKVVRALEQEHVKEQLTAYLRKYNELVSQSAYLSAQFDHGSADTVNKKLSSTGFFKAGHSVSLSSKAGGRAEIKDRKAFELLVADEKKRIKAGLDSDWEKIDKGVFRNSDLHEFRRIVKDNAGLLERLLADPEKLRRDLWLSYFAAIGPLHDVVGSYRSRQSDIAEIVKQAKAEKARWEEVVREFKGRFFVPFDVKVAEVHQSVLEGKMPTLQFDFDDGVQKTTVTLDKLQRALSAGEQRALYILNVLFKIKKRIADGKETVVVLDDIVDSFDYANKYAIIQYLKEISTERLFHLVLLTHNFDFFRAVMNRRIVGRKNCYYASKELGNVSLEEAPNIRSMLKGIIECKAGDPEIDEKFVASIPFARNLAEYKDGSGEYDTLTSLLHWRPETPEISIGDLQETIRAVIPKIRTERQDTSRAAYDVIMETADRCSDRTKNSLYGKVALSVAIRVRAERFMRNKLGPDSRRDKNPDTHDLIMDCKSRLPKPQADTLDLVGIMTPGIIHLNAFMYEPIVDIDDTRLRELFKDVRSLEDSA